MTTLVKADMEELVLRYLKEKELFKAFCRGLDSPEQIKDITFNFTYNPKPPEAKVAYVHGLGYTSDRISGWSPDKLGRSKSTGDTRPLKEVDVVYEDEAKIRKAFTKED
jgi:hypothetical protein